MFEKLLNASTEEELDAICDSIDNETPKISLAGVSRLYDIVSTEFRRRRIIKVNDRSTKAFDSDVVIKG